MCVRLLSPFMAHIFLLSSSVIAAVVVGAPSTIVVTWSSSLRPLATAAAHQLVVNPVTTRESFYHDAVYEKIASLGAPFQRYVPWHPYPRLAFAALEAPSTNLCGFVNSAGSGNMWSTTLDCGRFGAGTIDSVVFASYGAPSGACGSLAADAACAADVRAAVAAACVGLPACTLASNDETFGPLPCAQRFAVEVSCSNKAVRTFTSWNFTKLDEGMEDFLAAANSSGRSAIPNFSEIPYWLHNRSARVNIPDDPLGELWNYRGNITNDFVDPSLRELGDYFGRLVAHWVEGGFVDEGGRFVPGFNFSFSHWEVLNEIQDQFSPTEYTRIYDAIVAGIRRWAPLGSARMKFVGLALGGTRNYTSFVPYFLNASNHVPGTPVDMISFHNYGHASKRDGGVDGQAYESFFTSGDLWLLEVADIVRMRAASDFPSVLLNADEVGVILPDDNDATWTSTQPGFPALLWNAAGAMYAYLYGRSAELGLDVLGHSQMIGYPALPFPRSFNASWVAPAQYPSVSLLCWGGAFGAPGDGTAKYYTQKLLLEELVPGPPAGTALPADADVLVATSVSPCSNATCSPVYAQAFMTAGQGRKVLVVNKGAAEAQVALAGAAGGAWRVVDEATAFGPPRDETLTTDTWTLAPFAVGILRLAAPTRASAAITMAPVVVYNFSSAHCPAFPPMLPPSCVPDTRGGCDPDIPDACTRAWAPPPGGGSGPSVRMLGSLDAVSRAQVGTSLTTLAHDCASQPYANNTRDRSLALALFRGSEWVESPYVGSDGVVYALVHVDQYNTTTSPQSLYSAVTLFSSADGGATFAPARPPPAHLVATSPFDNRDSKLGRGIGFGMPSSILKDPASPFLYVILLANWGKDVLAQAGGLCLARTADVSDPSSWRGWAGPAAGFSAALDATPLLAPVPDPAAHTCTPLRDTSGALLQMRHLSLLWSTYFSRFLLFGEAGTGGWSSLSGWAFSLSDDLIHWDVPTAVDSGQFINPNGTAALSPLLPMPGRFVTAAGRPQEGSWWEAPGGLFKAHVFSCEPCPGLDACGGATPLSTAAFDALPNATFAFSCGLVYNTTGYSNYAYPTLIDDTANHASSGRDPSFNLVGQDAHFFLVTRTCAGATYSHVKGLTCSMIDPRGVEHRDIIRTAVHFQL